MTQLFPKLKGQKLTLTIPSKASYSYQVSTAQYNDKDYYWRYIRPFIAWTSIYETIEWEGDEKLRQEVVSAYNAVCAKKTTAAKNQMVTLYAVFYGSTETLKKYFSAKFTKRGLELAREEVHSGVIAISKIGSALKWGKIVESSWYYLDHNTSQKWTSNDDSTPLAVGSYLTRGESGGGTGWYSSSCTYVVPEAALSAYIYGLENAPLKTFENPKEENPELLHFQTGNFANNAEQLKTLIAGGVVQPTQSKVGVSAIKKMGSFLNLTPFPDCMSLLPRDAYVANLAISAFGEPGEDFYATRKFDSDSSFLKSVFDALNTPMKPFLGDILRPHVRYSTLDLLYHFKKNIALLFESIVSTLKESNGWTDYQAIYTATHCEFFNKGGHYIFPTVSDERPERVKTPGGSSMPMCDFKRNIHDIIFRAMVEGIAAIGGLDLMFSRKGEIAFLQLTELGKWYIGLREDLPEITPDVTAEDALDIDPTTGMIVIKNPDYPYTSIIAEFAAKVTDTRYVITGQSLRARCYSVGEFKAKISRMKRFIIPKPSGKIAELIKTIEGRFDPIGRTQKASTYTLYDVNPSDPRLLEIITGSEEIRQNTLRVEGCRLLIKTTFIPHLREILLHNGYLFT